jgi:hypothetical protein
MITLPELAVQDLGSFLSSDAKDRFGTSPREGANFEGLPVWRIFPRPIIGDFGTKQIDLDTSSLLHPGGSNAAQEPA